MAKQLPARLSYILVLLLFCACTTDKKVIPAKNIVTVRLPTAPDNLNPYTINAYAQQVSLKLFSSLLSFDANKLTMQPFLAKQLPEIELLPDGKTNYTYEIHEEARWDNGDPVLASDYVFTLKVLFNPYAQTNAFVSYLDFVEDVKIDDKNPRKFTILSNKQYILIKVNTGSMPILPEYLFDPEHTMANFSLAEMVSFLNEKPTAAQATLLAQFGERFTGADYTTNLDFLRGSGPYRLAEWQPAQKIVLEKKKGWWGDQLAAKYPMLTANPEKIIYRPIVDDASMLTELKSGALDVVSNVQANSFFDLKRNTNVQEQFNLYTPPSLLYYFIALNGANPKLEDKRVRRALAHLVDVEEIIETVMQGLGERIHGPIHPKRPYFHDSLAFIPFSVAQAQALLKAAGWVDSNNDGIVDKVIDGERVDLSLTIKIGAGNDTGKSIAILFKENARKAGVKIEIEAHELSKLRTLVRQRDYEMAYRAWSLPETLDDLKQVWHTKSQLIPDGNNYVNFGDVVSDELIEAIRTNVKETERNQLYQQIQEVIYDEQPYIFLFTPKGRLVIHKRFQAQTSIKFPGYHESFFSLAQEEFVGN
ncbi:MAG: ABC transporter substrate-binding protein [Saprospiraceae bacterium]